MNVTLTPTIDIDDIKKEMGTSNFPFMQGIDNNSYISVSLDESALTFYRMDIDFWDNCCNNPFEKQRAINMYNFIIKMNEMGYHDSILVYAHW